MMIKLLLTAAIGFALGFLIALIIYMVKRNHAFKIVAHAKSIAEEI